MPFHILTVYSIWFPIGLRIVKVTDKVGDQMSGRVQYEIQKIKDGLTFGTRKRRLGVGDIEMIGNICQDGEIDLD